MPDGRQPMVLLPGLGLDATLWDPLLGPLSRHFDPHVVELDLDGDPTPRAAAARLAAAVRARTGSGPVHLVGQSYGATTALHLAHLVPTASVTALAPVGFWTTPEREVAARLLGTAAVLVAALPPRLVDRITTSAAARRALLGLFAGRPGTVPAPRAAQALHAFAAAAPAVRRTVARFPHVELPRPPEVPVVLGWGSRDLITPAHQSRRARGWAPHAQQRLLRGAGHVAVWTHRADVLDAIGAATGTPDLAARAW